MNFTAFGAVFTYPAYILVGLAILVLCNALDIALTKGIVSRPGGREHNFIVAFFMQRMGNLPGLLFVKVVGLLIIIPVVGWLEAYYDAGVILFLDVLYIYVVLKNYEQWKIQRSKPLI